MKEIPSGRNEGDFHPKDGQLVSPVWTDGDYSIEDGCVHRVRYTVGKVRKPSGSKFTVREFELISPPSLRKNLLNLLIITLLMPGIMNMQIRIA